MKKPVFENQKVIKAKEDAAQKAHIKAMKQIQKEIKRLLVAE